MDRTVDLMDTAAGPVVRVLSYSWSQGQSKFESTGSVVLEQHTMRDSRSIAKHLSLSDAASKPAL